MTDLSRRKVLAGAAAGAVALGASVTAKAAAFGNPDNPPEGRINAKPSSVTEPGPHNPALSDQMPSFENPPATDVNGMEIFWSSFSLAHKRIQNGGWAREVTTQAFPISKDISGVNMRLGAGGVRELHWHQQAEWAIMVSGTCRITTLDGQGRSEVSDVGVGDIWYFPPGLPHSLQGLGPDGAEFVLAFDNGAAGEFNTLMVTDFFAHVPPEVLAQNFGVSQEAFKNIPTEQRWIYQGTVPGPLADDQRAAASPLGKPEHPFIFRFSASKPVKSSAAGMVQIADTSNFPVSKTIAAAMVTLKPGCLRELHWHQNADEWQYYIKGKGRMTVFNTGPQAQTADFNPGDIGYVKKGLGHYVQNVGNDDLVFLELFKAERFEEVSLSEWLANSPPQMVMELLNLDAETVAKFKKVRLDILPANPAA
ncbi:MAG: cupin domain-containing protein [Janthinobacterium lividum]